MTLPLVPTFDKTYTMPASREKVFAALTDAAALRIWFAQHAQVQGRVGGAYRFWGRHTFWQFAETEADGRILKLDTPGLLEYAWTWHGAPSVVTMTLEVTAGATSLR